MTIDERLRQMAQELWDKHGDLEVATNIMFEQIVSDKMLYKELADRLIRDACYDKLRFFGLRHARKESWVNKPDWDSAKERTKALAVSVKATLMNFPLPILGGLKLCDATGEQLLIAANWYLQQGGNMLLKGRWLRITADHVPAHKIAKTVLTEKKLRKFRHTAEAEIKDLLPH